MKNPLIHIAGSLICLILFIASIWLLLNPKDWTGLSQNQHVLFTGCFAVVFGFGTAAYLAMAHRLYKP